MYHQEYNGKYGGKTQAVLCADGGLFFPFHHSCIAVHTIILFVVLFLYIHMWMKALIVNIYWIFKSYREQSKKYIWNNWIVWVLLTLAWTFLTDSTEGGRGIFLNEKKAAREIRRVCIALFELLLLVWRCSNSYLAKKHIFKSSSFYIYIERRFFWSIGKDVHPQK